jgi:hypothetical protein
MLPQIIPFQYTYPFNTPRIPTLLSYHASDARPDYVTVTYPHMTDGTHQYCMYKHGNIIDAQPWYIYISHGVTTTLHPVVDEAIDTKPPVLLQYARI